MPFRKREQSNSYQVLRERTIITVPDERLRKRSEPVPSEVIPMFGEKIHSPLDDDLKYLVNSLECYGIAAVQVGVLWRLAVVRWGQELLVLINPELLNTRGRILLQEECLSIPDLVQLCWRPKMARVRFTSPDGRHRTLKFNGIEAQAVIHELNHMDGILIDTPEGRGETQ